jgi:hypothetical protein
MKNLQIFFLFLAFSLLALMATNPSIEDHRQAVSEFINRKIGYSSNPLMKIINQDLIKSVSIDNYLLFSLTNIRDRNKKENIGFGILGNVWISNNTIDNNFTELKETKLVDNTRVQSKKSKRFIKFNDNFIKDATTGYYWLIAPDRDFNFYEAEQFTNQNQENNLIWELPSYDEIKCLFDRRYSAGEGVFINGKHYPAKIHPVFNSVGSGSWFWVSDFNADNSKANAINLHEGIKVNFNKLNPEYPVHLLLISKMELK